jgi:hypothetical protein
MDKEELFFENETRKHQQEVSKGLIVVIEALLERAKTHDSSKFESPEREIFVEYTPKLKDTTYNSKEYKECTDAMEKAIQHHYFINRHHPQYHLEKDAISGMNLVDIVEMFCDWMAAVKRHSDGDITKSIEINEKRFNINPQLSKIFQNTVEIFEKS